MTLTESKTITKDFSYRDAHYVLNYYPEIQQYGAIPYENLSSSGKLKKPMNGLQLHLSDSISSLITALKQTIDIEYYQTMGMTFAEAMCKVYDIPYDAKYEDIFVKKSNSN